MPRAGVSTAVHVYDHTIHFYICFGLQPPVNIRPLYTRSLLVLGFHVVHEIMLTAVGANFSKVPGLRLADSLIRG